MTDANPDTHNNKIVELYDKEAEACDRMEHWGLTIIIGGIGAITYKLVEWVSVLNAGCLSQATFLIIIVPLFVGIWGMLFLYTINFRGRKAKLYRYKAMSKKPYYGEELKPYIGWLGRIICNTPLFTGYGASIMVYLSRFPTLRCWHYKLVWMVVLLLILLIGIVEIIYTVRYRKISGKLKKIE